MTSIMEYVRDRRILVLIVVVVLLAGLDLYYGLHFGIEFAGGTQIPITLEHPVNVSTMSTLISALDQRLSTFGLQQVTVEGIGDQEIYVIIPTVTASEVNQTLNIIQSQGRFDGVVNGKEAINGTGIVKGSIGPAPVQVFNNTVTWQVNFFITQQAAQHFSSVVFGQANKPLFLFLDRPTSAIVLINPTGFGNVSLGLTSSQEVSQIQQALTLTNETIPVVSVTNTNSSIAAAKSFFVANKGKYTTVFASASTNQSLIAYISSLNYTVHLESNANMTPTFTPVTLNASAINSWPLVGLISAPVLNPGVTNGSLGTSYQISGAAPLSLPQAQRLSYAQNQSTTISSVLSGGALPVSVIPGTPTTIPATLGAHFLYVSGIAALVAVLFVSIFIVLRYRKRFLVVPILLTTLVELFIIVSIIGIIGTIDLAAVAGMIAVIGTGVDAQVIITDEILARRGGSSGKTLLNNAFYIVWRDVALLIVAMLPLFFSTSLVTVIGFSEATIFGALLSVLITRPAYGAIISKRFSE